MKIRAALFLTIASAIAAVVVAVYIGHGLFEDTVVRDPYEAGLRWDQQRRQTPTASDVQESIRCEIQSGPCVKGFGNGLELTFDIRPKPVRAMRDLEFFVILERSGHPADMSEVRLSLSMPGMVMGDNRPALSPAGPGKYGGRGVIPACPSGAKVWRADVQFSMDQQSRSAAFEFAHE